MAHHAWWDEDCVARGAALKHRHWNECPHGHAPDQCCHCEEFPPVDPQDEGTFMSAIDLNARLAGFGMSAGLPPPGYDILADAGAGHDDDAPREPRMRMLTDFPNGPAWERGRSWDGAGNLHNRDKARLEYVLFNERIHQQPHLCADWLCRAQR